MSRELVVRSRQERPGTAWPGMAVQGLVRAVNDLRHAAARQGQAGLGTATHGEVRRNFDLARHRPVWRGWARQRTARAHG